MSRGSQYVIWGSKGHAKVLADILLQRESKVVALFDNDQAADSILNGVPLFYGDQGFRNWSKKTDPSQYCGLVAIGGAHGKARQKIHRLFIETGITVPALFHSTASVANTAKIGNGSQVLAHAMISADAKVGDCCIINNRSGVDHECILENGVHIAPGATLCGCIHLEENVFVGAGAVILPNLKIGANTIIGAGAVVTKDLPSKVTVAGNPARIINHQ